MALIWRLVAVTGVVIVVICTMAAKPTQAHDTAWNEAKLLSEFNKWMKKFGKDKLYGSNPILKLKRFKTFKNNVQYMLSRNNISSSLYTLGLNGFTDLTYDEAVASLLVGRDRDGGTRGDNQTSSAPRQVHVPDATQFCSVALLPRNLDWRSRGKVTPIKDQGQCGSCWAFAAVAAIESAYAIKTGRLYRLSEQELVSCDTKYSDGCQGGYKSYAIQWVIDNGGIDTDADYPYFSGQTGAQGVCNIQKARTRKVAKISGLVSVPVANEPALLCAVAKRPVAVSIHANNDFLRYAGGIFDAGTDCPYQAGTSNHAVTLVGWGQNVYGVKYWIVKNSWGSDWGMNGYAYIRRGGRIPQGVCGVNNYPVYPVV